jgi:CheY-like chemotaxis protein
MATILVVDDRPDARYVMTRTLTAAGFDVLEAPTGMAALRVAKLQQPAAIVLDIALGDRDGFEAVRRLKADAATQHIPVIHKTAVYRDPSHRQRSVDSGADGYLAEPLERGELVEAVRRVLSHEP